MSYEYYVYEFDRYLKLDAPLTYEQIAKIRSLKGSDRLDYLESLDETKPN